MRHFQFSGFMQYIMTCTQQETEYIKGLVHEVYKPGYVINIGLKKE